MSDRQSERESIRDVALRYCRGLDRLDAACMRSAYWPDATDDHGTFVGSGWEFVDRCMLSHTRWRSTLHCLHNHFIDLAAGSLEATGEAYVTAYLFPLDAAPAQLWCGRYLDVYEKRDGQWRIRRRVYVSEGTALLESGPTSSTDPGRSHGASPARHSGLADCGPDHGATGLGRPDRVPDGRR